jgi:hypothetical protein
MENWTIVRCGEQWLIGIKGASSDEDLGYFNLTDVWGIWHQVGVQPGPQGPGSFNIMQTPALVIPLLNSGKGVESMWVRPTIEFTPDEADQKQWREGIENARRATIEQRTGLKLASSMPPGKS